MTDTVVPLACVGSYPSSYCRTMGFASSGHYETNAEGDKYYHLSVTGSGDWKPVKADSRGAAINERGWPIDTVMHFNVIIGHKSSVNGFETMHSSCSDLKCAASTIYRQSETAACNDGFNPGTYWM